MTSVPALGTTLTAMLESSRARVTALKKEKQPFQPELVRMQKMKAILGEGNKPSAPSAPKAKAQQPVVGGGLAPVEEDPNQEAKEVDEEKEARKAAKKAAKEAEKAAKAERKKAIRCKFVWEFGTSQQLLVWHAARAFASPIEGPLGVFTACSISRGVFKFITMASHSHRDRVSMQV